MRCQNKVNCNSQVCWRQENLQELWLQKEEEDDGFDGCLGCENDKIWKQSLFVQKKTWQSQRYDIMHACPSRGKKVLGPVQTQLL